MQYVGKREGLSLSKGTESSLKKLKQYVNRACERSYGGEVGERMSFRNLSANGSKFYNYKFFMW